MHFRKHKLRSADMGYAVSTLKVLGEERIAVASEGFGPAQIFDGVELTPKTISSEPGGSMGFAALPGRDDVLFMITRFYPIFKSEQAGIDLCVATDGLEAPWLQRRIVDLPFVHRISSAKTAAGSFLFAATVCGGKEYQEDWRKPGAVYAITIPDYLDGEWKAVPILEGLHRNHGMAIGIYEGRETLLVSADEGVFAIPVPQNSGEKWSSRCILEQSVSELGCVDLDGDGEDELVTVEPFHGGALGVYKKTSGQWTKVSSESLAFGHGLTVGSIQGEPAIVVGNRSDTKDLVCYRVRSADPIELERIIIDRGSGSAGTAIVSTPEGDAIVSSNPEFAEYAMYVVTGENA